MTSPALRLAVVGAGPVGLALALHAARVLPHAAIALFDARPATHDPAADPRTLALSLGSVRFLEQLQAWPAAQAAPILRVHVSQAAPTWRRAEVWIDAAELQLPMLGAVLTYGALVSALQRRWEQAVSAEPARLQSRFGTPVAALKTLPDSVEVDAGVVETVDLAVVAEGGLLASNPAAALDAARARAPAALQLAYRQTAWVGNVELQGAEPGLAFERFTRHGPAALLPLPAPSGGGARRAALVWCVDSRDDPVRGLGDVQRVAVLNTLFPARAGRITAVSALKPFALGLHAERTLATGRTVRIGNAAQTLHPVAGQGLNLGLRDAHALVAGLRHGRDAACAVRRITWARAADRWSVIAGTDALARLFTLQGPGAATARGVGLAALQAAPPLKAWVARRMMFGAR